MNQQPARSSAKIPHCRVVEVFKPFTFRWMKIGVVAVSCAAGGVGLSLWLLGRSLVQTAWDLAVVMGLLGVPLIVCPGISKVVNRGDVIEFNMTTGTVLNKTSGKTLQAQPLSDYVMNILASGGIKPLIKKQMEG